MEDLTVVCASVFRRERVLLTGSVFLLDDESRREYH